MNDDPSNLLNSPAKIKAFIEKGPEDHYGEVFINIDLQSGTLAFRDKDVEYHAGILSSLAQSSYDGLSEAAFNGDPYLPARHPQTYDDGYRFAQPILRTWMHAMATLPALPALAPGLYRHYKGNDYEVVAVARHSETLEPVVVYRALYGEGGLWVRPYAMFCEEVAVDGRSVRRFAPVE